MADLSITPSNVIGLSNVSYVQVSTGYPLAGVAISAGDICYIDSDSLVQLSQNTTAVKATNPSIALCDAAVGQPVFLAQGGTIQVAASGLVVGTVYFVSTNAGKIMDTLPVTSSFVSMFCYVYDATSIIISRVVTGLAKG